MSAVDKIFQNKTQPPVVDWRTKFHTVSELATGDVKMYVEGILPEGITGIGSLSAVGKTWFALSMACALTTGKPFLGCFAVPEKVPVIYLVPEMGERSIRRRAEKLGLPMNDQFRCQTVSDGVCRLTDPVLFSAVEELKPILFLDTAVRFNPAGDENDARQSANLLGSELFNLRKMGARAVVFLHHSPKYSGDAEFMTLENVLRGTGDLGAMCDAVWGLQQDKRRSGKDWDFAYLQESQDLTRLYVKCVKPRDFEPVPPFRIQGRPYIDEKGDFVVLAEETPEIAAQIIAEIEKNPKVSQRHLLDKFRIGRHRLSKIAYDNGWMASEKKGWERRESGFGPRASGQGKLPLSEIA